MGILGVSILVFDKGRKCLVLSDYERQKIITMRTDAFGLDDNESKKTLTMKTTADK